MQGYLVWTTNMDCEKLPDYRYLVFKYRLLFRLTILAVTVIGLTIFKITAIEIRMANIINKKDK